MAIQTTKCPNCDGWGYRVLNGDYRMFKQQGCPICRGTGQVSHVTWSSGDAGSTYKFEYTAKIGENKK